jgi:hypothetical protein
MMAFVLGALTAFLAGAIALTPAAPPAAKTFELAAADLVRPIGVRVTADTHLDRNCVRVVGLPDFKGEQVALLDGSDLENGVIEADIAGQPLPGASSGARGFVGIVFRAASDGSSLECFYMRPTNGRADDQVRRNHSVQYVSIPGFSFDAFRREAPERYESYVDLVPGDWTHLRIEFEGAKARLFVHAAPQPTLIVNDLEGKARSGAVALWIGDETEAWFRHVVVQRAATNE